MFLCKSHLGALLFCAVASQAMAASDFISGNRTVSVWFDQPVENVSVHITGTRPGTGCIKPKSMVYVMNFLPASEVVKNNEIAGKIAAAYGKVINGEISAKTQSSASSKTPAVYSYNFTGLVTNLHYNVVYTRGGKQFALGWRPDNGGGCTYPL
jgi:hypothetical protein